MPSLRESMMGLALGAVVVVGAVTAMAQNGQQAILQKVGVAELSVANAAAAYLNANPTAAPGNITISSLVSTGYLPSSFSSGLSPVGDPLEISVYTQSGGGIGVLVYTKYGNGTYSTSNGNVYAFMHQNGHFCAGRSDGSFTCYLGAIKGALSHYGVAAPTANDQFAPMAWDWVPATPVPPAPT